MDLACLSLADMPTPPPTRIEMSHNRHIKIGSWNVQGLYTRTVDKTLECDFVKEIEGIDILALVETHLVEGQSNICTIQGYETKFFQ